MRKQSILISMWQVFELKGKGTKVGTIMVIGTEIGTEKDIVIGGTRMTTKRRLTDMFY